MVHSPYMQKSTVFGAIAIIIILGLILFYAASRPKQALAPKTSTSLPASPYIEHTQYYDIAANFATSTPLSGAANTRAVSEMKQFVADTIDQFKKDGNFANLTPEDVKTLGFDQGRKEKLQIMYLIAPTERTVTYVFTIYLDTLGAHGNTFFRTFAYDTQTGASLSLGDLFKPGTDYLDTLSTLSAQKLPALIGEGADIGMIKDGTTPDAKNFENFFFDGNDFVILFPPYAVAAYAAGPQTLRIPTSELSNILKPEYIKK